MGKPRRPRMMFSCSEEVKTLLEKSAEEEGRSISNVIERIINEAIATKYSVEITTKPYQRKTAPLPPEVNDDDDLNAEDFLRILLSGRLPTDGELIEVATTLGVKAEKLIELRTKLQGKKKAANGS